METKPENLVLETRLDSVRLAIWKNRDKDGNAFYSVNINRRYKSGPNEWANSNHYTGLGQVTLLRKAASIAEQFLVAAEINE